MVPEPIFIVKIIPRKIVGTFASFSMLAQRLIALLKKFVANRAMHSRLFEVNF